MIDNKIEEPVIEFISEDPYLQYVSIIATCYDLNNAYYGVLYYDAVHVQNFRVTGKCIGQFSSECTQYYAEKVL